MDSIEEWVEGGGGRGKVPLCFGEVEHCLCCELAFVVEGGCERYGMGWMHKAVGDKNYGRRSGVVVQFSDSPAWLPRRQRKDYPGVVKL